MYLTALLVAFFMPVAIFLAAVILWILFVYPKQSNFPVEDALIVAAHSDDCVITAGEYGIECLRRGKSLRIVYMTCGTENPTSELAITRRKEAEVAWSEVNLAPNFLTFIDAPASQVDEERSRAASWEHRIVTTLKDAVAHLAAGSVVILPAAGERHVDHRMLRRITLSVIVASSRKDITIYEVPSYSKYVSLICNPLRALRVLLSFLPIGWRIAKMIAFDVPYGQYATFARGAMRLPRDEGRLRLKCKMLSAFASQGGEALIAAFGRPDVLRRLKPEVAARERELPFGIALGHVVCTGSTLLLLCSLAVSILAAVAIAIVELRGWRS